MQCRARALLLDDTDTADFMIARVRRADGCDGHGLDAMHIERRVMAWCVAQGRAAACRSMHLAKTHHAGSVRREGSTTARAVRRYQRDEPMLVAPVARGWPESSNSTFPCTLPCSCGRSGAMSQVGSPSPARSWTAGGPPQLAPRRGCGVKSCTTGSPQTPAQACPPHDQTPAPA